MKFTSTLPIIFCFFDNGVDRYGVGIGTEQHNGRPMSVVESKGETFRFNWLQDAFTAHYPHNDDYGVHLQALMEQEIS